MEGVAGGRDSPHAPGVESKGKTAVRWGVRGLEGHGEGVTRGGGEEDPRKLGRPG